MPNEHKVAIAGLVFLLIGGLMLVASVRRGRELCRLLAQRLPEEYVTLGSPQPGYFDSPRRQAYFRFIMQRRFTELSDPHLVAEFTKLHRTEMRQLIVLLAGFGGLGIALVWLNWFQAA